MSRDLLHTASHPRESTCRAVVWVDILLLDQTMNTSRSLLAAVSFSIILALSTTNGQVTETLAVFSPSSSTTWASSVENASSAKNKPTVRGIREVTLDRSQRVEQVTPRFQHPPGPLLERKATDKDRKCNFRQNSWAAPSRVGQKYPEGYRISRVRDTSHVHGSRPNSVASMR